MDDAAKTKPQLLEELRQLRARVSELEDAETERQRAEDASRVFQSAVEQSRDGILITDSAFRITFMNRSAAEYFGLAPGGLLGEVVQEAFNISPETEARMDESLAAQGSWTGLIEVACHDSPPKTIELTHLLISGDRGDYVGTVSFMKDVRQTRRIESLQRVAEVAADAETGDREAIRQIMVHLPELVDLKLWGVFRYNPESGRVEPQYFSEEARVLVEADVSFPSVGTILAQPYLRHEILSSHDVLSDHRFTNDPGLRHVVEVARTHNLRAMCILPIRSAGTTLGTLHLVDHRVRTFTPEEVSILKTLASQIGMVLGRGVDGPSPERVPGPARLGTVSVVAESDAMKRVKAAADNIAATDLPVIILGATGVGKGHLAKYIHGISTRSDEPYLMVNCACLDGELILSELFGHERGSFTGAVRQQKGCFELANGGTLLLDEVVELPDTVQAKLLQLVETQQFRRLGGQQTITTDVRLICTTNSDIRECVRTGKFRQDLYYRLSVGEIHIPPLRDRIEDIEPLAVAHLRTQALASGQEPRRLTDAAVARLRAYRWPGNVRELQNVLTQASAQCDCVISAEDLRFSPIEEPTAAPVQSSTFDERHAILEVLRRHDWNRTLAARELGIHRNTLRERMRKHKIFECMR